MSLSFKPSDLPIPRGRRSGPIPSYVETTVQAAVKTGKTQGAEGTHDEIHRAYLDFRRYKLEHDELVVSISERHPKANEEGPSRLMVEAHKAE